MGFVGRGGFKGFLDEKNFRFDQVCPVSIF